MISVCLHHAIAIQRSKPAKQWGEEIKKIPVECREECAEYLRGIYRRAAHAKVVAGKLA
jgi:hypothetical protein